MDANIYLWFIEFKCFVLTLKYYMAKSWPSHSILVFNVLNEFGLVVFENSHNVYCKWIITLLTDSYMARQHHHRITVFMTFWCHCAAHQFVKAPFGIYIYWSIIYFEARRFISINALKIRINRYLFGFTLTFYWFHLKLHFKCNTFESMSFV